MTVGIDLITGLITSVAYDNIRRPLRALTDIQSRRRALAASRDNSGNSDTQKLIEKSITDLTKYIANSEGAYTKQTATFLHELSKTAIPDSIKLLVASGRDVEPIFVEFKRVYDLFNDLPFEDREFYRLLCTAIKTRFEESIDSKIILEAINGRAIEVISKLDALGAAIEQHSRKDYSYGDFSEDRLRVARSIESANKYLTVETNAGAKKIALTKMVVPARLTEVSDASEIPSPHRDYIRHQVSGTNFIAFRRSFYNAVILGDPGGGKTTLTQHMCQSLSQQIILESSNPLDKYFDVRDLKLPLRVILRRFEARTKSDVRYNILDYLVDDLRPIFNNHEERTLSFLSHLLSTGQAVIIFDGLDEILDVAVRREIVSIIEAFSHQYPSCPALVTSRIVGYADAPMSSEFKIFTLARFNDQEIDKYALNFLRAISGEKQEIVSLKVKKFLDESSTTAPDLRENPLLLGLMIYIFNARGDVPNNRPEIYRECSLLMFERWDQRRDIKFNVPGDFDLLDLFAFLASKIFGDSDYEEGVDSIWLEARLREYFDLWYQDKAKSVASARTLVDFITGRAWVMCEIGPGVFKFTHRTFLEYFFARRVEEESGSINNLVKNDIFPKATKAQWDVVTHLALQIATFRSSPKSRQALDALMEELSTADINSEELLNYLHFVIRSLDYLVISEIEISRVCAVICEWVVSLKGRDPIEVADLFYSLFSVRGAASGTIVPIVSQCLKEAAASLNIIKSSNAIYVLGARLAGFRGYSQATTGSFDFSLVWEKTSDVRKVLRTKLLERAIADQDYARSYFYIYRDSVKELIATHSIEFLFSRSKKKMHHDERFCAFFCVIASTSYVLKGDRPFPMTDFELTREDADIIFKSLKEEVVKNPSRLRSRISQCTGKVDFDLIDYFWELFNQIAEDNKGLVRRIPDFSDRLAVLLFIRNAMQDSTANAVSLPSTTAEHKILQRRIKRVSDKLPKTLPFFSEKASVSEISEVISSEGKKLLKSIMVVD